MATCPECGSENAGDARFCSTCGAAQSPRAPERRKLATLFFCDMVGSTALGEQVDAETLREIMARFFEQSRAVIELHGGTVEKFVGDAVMAVFGVPVTHEDDAVRAVRAAWELQAGVAELNRELEARHGARIALRIGLNTGEVVAGGPARAGRCSSRETPSTSPPASSSTPAPVRRCSARPRTASFEMPSRSSRVEPIAAKGKSEPLSAVRLVAVSGDSRPRPGVSTSR